MPTKIEWATESWNPITGCTPVSEGCQNCYARRMASRLRGRFGYPKDDPFRVTFHPDKIEQPLHWKKPRMIFVCSMGDLFHEDVEAEWILRILMVIRQCPEHIFLMLTKRPKRMSNLFNHWVFTEALADMSLEIKKAPNNLWLGVTAENQQRADERIPILLQIPAAKRFVSIEPMLGPVDLIDKPWWDWRYTYDFYPKEFAKKPIDWVICGGESGPGARPMHPDWPRSIRDQCQAADASFFFKQWGAWQPHSERLGGGIFLKPDGMKTCQGDYWDGHAAAMDRVGKKALRQAQGHERNRMAAGRLLDGREWNEYPNKELSCLNQK